MRKNIWLIIIAILCFQNGNTQSLSSFFTKTDQFMKKYVSSGKVNYKGIRSNPNEIYELSQIISSANLSGKKANEKKAFYINAYNLLVIGSIVKNYPTSGPNNIPGFFDKTKHKIAGEFLTLNDIENKKVRIYKDARIHFALVCAAKSCPKIPNFAFKPETLNSQLSSRASIACNDSYFIRLKSKTVYISEIFKWYKEDFLLKNKSVLEYINSFRKKEIPSSYKVQYYTYNWNLNE